MASRSFPLPLPSALLSALLSRLSWLGRQAGHWRPQASWSLGFPVVGKENAGGGDCSGHEKRNRKQCLKARRQRRWDWQISLRSSPGWPGKGGGSREGVLRKIGLLNEPIFCLGCPSWRNCPPSLKPVMKASRIILDPTPKTSLLFGPTQLPYQDLCFLLPDLWGSACVSKDLSLVLAFFFFVVLYFLEN